MGKRCFDFVTALIGILLLSPLLIAAALCVRLTSPGPVFFRQVRVGRHERPFRILKFRSMRPSAGGPEITVAGDDRVTPVGRILRRTKLDELPQLFNVLAGDMSLVGPRPEVPRYVALYPAELRRIVLCVRPGITDNAAIEFRNESELLAQAADAEAEYVGRILPRKLELYRRYVETQSFLGDLRILMRTLAAVVRV